MSYLFKKDFEVTKTEWNSYVLYLTILIEMDYVYFVCGILLFYVLWIACPLIRLRKQDMQI